MGIGNWQEMIDLSTATGLIVEPRRPSVTRVSSAMGWARYSEIVGTSASARPAVPAEDR